MTGRPINMSKPWEMTKAFFVAHHTNKFLLSAIESLGWPEGSNYIERSSEYARLTGYHGMLRLAVEKGKRVPANILRPFPDLKIKKPARKPAAKRSTKKVSVKGYHRKASTVKAHRVKAYTRRK